MVFIKVQVKIRDIRKLKKRIVSELVFMIMKTRKNIQSISQKTLLKYMFTYY